MKGQIAVELLLIFGTFLLLVSIIGTMALHYFSEKQKEVSAFLSLQECERLRAAVASVCSEGEGYLLLEITVPHNCRLSIQNQRFSVIKCPWGEVAYPLGEEVGSPARTWEGLAVLNISRGASGCEVN